MTALRCAVLIALAAAAPAAFADNLRCESRPGDGPQPCSTLNPGSDVRMTYQFGATRCVEGRNWSAQNDSIWVSDGCSAEFDIEAYGAAAGSATGDPQGGTNAYHRDDPADDSPTGSERERDDRSIADSRGDRTGDADEDDDGDQRYDADSRYADDGRDDDPGRSPDRDREDRRYAYAEGRESARQACIDEAAIGQRFGPDRISAGAQHRIGRGLYSIDLDTPTGSVECIVDRHGNIHALER